MKKPKVLTEKQIQAALVQLPGWKFKRNALAKIYEFADFRTALAFMVKSGFEAEALNHHPEWTNVYSRVEVRLTTHDAGNNVTSNDVELASRLDRAAQIFSR